jgi:N,N'-diacetyllegionaminate synthase
MNKVYIIAEIGINHMGNMDKAKKLIDAAVRSGVDAVKFQTYITEKRAPKDNDQIFDILKKCELPFE